MTPQLTDTVTDIILHPGNHPDIAQGVLQLADRISQDDRTMAVKDYTWLFGAKQTLLDGRRLTAKGQLKAHRILVGAGFDVPDEPEITAFLTPPPDQLDIDQKASHYWVVRNLTKGTGPYNVALQHGEYTCSCPGSPNCKHIKAIRELNEFPTQAVETQTWTTADGKVLNHDQVRALNQLLEWFDLWSDYGRTFLLQGYAGTGKSTLIQEFVRQVQKQHPRLDIAIAAPTNKAKHVLAAMARETGLKVTPCTIHQLLGLRLKITDDGKEIFEADPFSNGPFLSDYELVIVDEASMIGRKLYAEFTQALGEENPSKVLFVGDPAQLPPVNESKGIVFNEVVDTFLLKEVVRYGGPILNLVTKVREKINLVKPIIPESDGPIEVINSSDWMDQLIEAVQKDDAAQVRGLAWTNKVVQFINQTCHQRIYGEAAERYIPGERLIALRPVLEGRSVLIPTASEVVVRQATPDKWGHFKTWKLQVLTDDQVYLNLWTIHEDSEEDLQHELKSLKKAALNAPKKSEVSKLAWRNYFELKQAFAQIDYCYATTIHKSQGSTYKQVFVALKDVLRNKKAQERNQLLYVAYSRASERLVISEA